MSWSFSAVGMPTAVNKSLQEMHHRIKCPEPEETIKAALVHAADVALRNMPSDQPVVVNANGTQGGRTPEGLPNQFLIEIKLLYGFMKDQPPEVLTPDPAPGAG
jgi:hypothetical protein